MPIKKKEQLLELATERRLRRVLVVTALALETRAVRAHIDHWGSSLGRLGAIYECGQFSAMGEEWFVVIAESGAGTHPAQGIVTNAHIDFGGFELVVFVGVAGSRKKDAPIGSVVASSVVYYAHSGKWDPKLGFAQRPRTFPVKPRLVSVANWVERERNWFSRVKPPYNGTLADESQYPQPFPPAALIAPVISVEGVLADPDSHLEKQIALHDNDAVAVEMEGYGAAYAAYEEETPFIVVRGISDRCGEAKTPEADAINQPVAAAHSSAFAFELIDGWGQFYPSAAPPYQPGPAVNEPKSTEVADSAAPSAKASETRSKSVFVLNFAGSPSDYPPQRIDQILEKLKEVSGADDIELIRTEGGSFRMFIRLSLPDPSRLDVQRVYHTLSQQVGVRLLGIQDEEEFQRTSAVYDAFKRASADMLAWPQNLPDGTHLPRPELGQLLSIIESAEHSTTALLGSPGSGKSALLAALGSELLGRRIPFLAIKADLLADTVQSEETLSESLNLPDRVSSLLIKTSQIRPVALIIDQLDALADYVDLRTGRLNALLNLIRKLGERRNVHIIVSSRTFEYEHDTRLKSVRAESMTLALPPWSAVLQVLESHGVLAAGWPPDAQELMRTPQALSTFLKLSTRNQEPFRKYQAMLDQLWNEQLLSKPHGPRLAALAGTIAETMAARETLWLAAAKFEDQADDVKALIASGILTDFEGTWSRIGFSHQTVFAHALARSFAKGHNRLSAFVLERQSSLFVRPKLWATLTYLREVEPSTYHEEMQTIWKQDDLRLHLRHMLIEFMGQQDAPTDAENVLYEEALNSASRAVALRAMAGSPGWLKLFRSSQITRAMQNSVEANIAAYILDRAWPFAPETVVSLIRHQWLDNPAMDGVTWSLLQDCPQWMDALTEIAKTIIRRTEINSFAFDRLISAVGVDAPSAALELAQTRLAAQIGKAIEQARARAAIVPPEDQQQRLLWYMSNSPSKPLTDVLEQRDSWDSLEAIAKSNPRLFLKYLWPSFLLALNELASLEGEQERLGFPVTYKVDMRLESDHTRGGVDAPLLGAIAAAVETFAAEHETEFLEWVAEREGDKFSPVQRLLAHGLALRPVTYAARSLQFLLSDTDRFYLGDIEDRSGTTKRLIRAASPFWTDNEISDFADVVSGYSPSAPSDLDAKGRQVFYNGIRKTKLGLLLALPEDRIKPEVTKYIVEERRRFPNERLGATFHGAEWVGSPIPAKNLALASDDDILNAFKKIPDASGWDNPKDWAKGGNVQLSREFAEFAKAHPERAIRIMKRFDPNIGSRASGYALDALAETADAGLLFEIISDLDQRGFKCEEFRDGVARAVQRMLRRDISIDDKTLAILMSWLSAPAPMSSSEEETDDDALGTDDNLANAGKKREESEGALWGHGGISFLPRGNYPILEVITRVLLDRKQPENLVDLYMQHLKRGDKEQVWEALTRYFRHIHPADPSTFSSFLRELFSRYPDLEFTREIAVALAYLHWEHEGLAHEIISRWRSSGRDGIRQTYGELVTLIAVTRPELAWPSELLNEVLGTPSMNKERVGAANTAVNMWSEEKFRNSASNILRTIIPVADKAAWSAVFDLFRLADEVTPENAWISLLEVIADHLSSAEGISSSYIVERLQTLLPHRAALVARLAQGLIENWSSELSDISTGTSLHAAELVDLAITLHRLGPETREAGTTLFERLLVLNAYMARETLDEIDSRFRATAPRPRRRLPKRTARPRRRAA